MKKLLTVLLISFLVSTNELSAQLLLPQFNPVEKDLIFSSKQEDSSPIFVNDGQAIFYNRTYTEVDGETTIVTDQEVWYVAKGKKGWEKPYRLLREDDLPGENLIVGANKTGSRIYVFNSLPEGDTLYRRLYYLDKLEEKYKWSAPTEVKIQGLELGNDFIQFYVNPEETAILVNKPPSENPNNEDIYVSLKDENGNWGSMINLGRTINTNRFELGSFITNDLKTLYFSSDGHGGFGAADIFVSMRLDDTWQNWTKPLNLGEQINSVDYDAFFTMADSNTVYFTSDRGDIHSNIYKGTITGEVVLARTDSMKGLFMHKGKPVKGINFKIVDSEGNKVANVTTDEKGVFKFEKLKGEENYMVQMEEEDSDFVGSKIYFLNEDEKKTTAYVYTRDGLFVNSKDIVSEEVVNGVFNYNSLPAIKTALVVFDENGFPLDTIYTDENGGFSYSVLGMENGFSLVPLNMTDDEFVNTDIYLIDEAGNRLQTIKPRQFHKLQERDNTLVANKKEMEQKGTTGIDVEKVKDAWQEVTAIESGDSEASTVYFEFEETQAKQEELNKLSVFASVVKLDPSKKIILTGHTDDSGEADVNYSFGLARAAYLRDYLISKGIDSKNIEVVSEGENKPKADNTTREGRIKNRRVEVRVK